MTARLVGGPFDGFEGEAEETPSPQIWVIECAFQAVGFNCPDGGVHWFPTKLTGAARYVLVTLDEQGARYEYGDLIDNPSGARTREREPIAV